MREARGSIGRVAQPRHDRVVVRALVLESVRHSTQVLEQRSSRVLDVVATTDAKPLDDGIPIQPDPVTGHAPDARRSAPPPEPRSPRFDNSSSLSRLRRPNDLRRSLSQPAAVLIRERSAIFTGIR